MQEETPANNLRAILPRAPDEQHSPQITQGERRIKRVTAACELCRQRRCDAVRPTCTACVSLDQECVYRTTPQETSVGALKRKFGELESHYDQLKASQDQLQQLLRAIRTRPDGDAKAIFESIRSGTEVETIVRNIHSGGLVSQLRVAPERRYRFDFPFKSEMPRFLQVPDNRYLQSPLHEAALAFSASEQQGSLIRTNESHHVPPYVKPYFTAVVVDPRLDKIKPSKWTRVSQDDHLMRHILRSYFLLDDYQFVGCFHKDDFLDDMLSGCEEHCTPLLVNSVLAQACHSCKEIPNRSDYWDPNTLGYKFFAEAKRLWELESMKKKSLTTLQTALIFNFLFNENTMDKIGVTYQTQAMDIAREIGLFDPATHVTRSSGSNSRAYTMWLYYWWSSAQDYHFHTYTPKDEFPPVQLPDPGINLEWYGETWLQYPQDAQTQRIGHGYLFKAKCELAMIQASACSQLYGEDQETEATRSEIARKHIDALRSWYAALPTLLSAEHIVYPCQLKLHMLYQDTMIRMCEHALSVPSRPLSNPPQHHPQSLLANSKISFETLMRLYYLRHGFESSDGYLGHYLHLLAYIAKDRLKASIDAPDSSTPTDVDDARATLFLAAKGLYDQSKNYYLALTLFCILQNDMRLEEANMLYKYAGIIRERSTMKRLRGEYIQAQYPIYITRPKDNEGGMRVLSEVVDDMEGLDLGSDGEASDGLQSNSQ